MKTNSHSFSLLLLFFSKLKSEIDEETRRQYMIEEKDPKGNKNIGQKEGEEEDEGYYDENGEFHYYEDEEGSE